MNVNVMGLLKNAAMSLRHDDPMTAYVLLELANNLRLVMRGEDTIEEFKTVYVGADKGPLDIDKLLPAPADA